MVNILRLAKKALWTLPDTERDKALAVGTAGVVLTLAIGVVDLVAVPDRWPLFLAIRAVATIGLGITTWLVVKGKLPMGSYHIYLGSTPIILMVEVMIFLLGGHTSSYYVGHILIIVFVFAYYPDNVFNSTKFSLYVLLLYVAPILLFDNIVHWRKFLEHIIFFVGVIVMGGYWRAFYVKKILQKEALQEDLRKEKDHLADRFIHTSSQLNMSEQKYQALLNNLTDGFIAMEPSGNILHANKKMLELPRLGHTESSYGILGIDEFIVQLYDRCWQKRAAGIDPSAAEQTAFANLSSGYTVERELTMPDGARTFRSVTVSAVPTDTGYYLQAIHKDMTEQKRLMDQVLHAQRMEAIGNLAGSVAHDFSNLLSVIKLHVSLVFQRGDLLDPATRKTLEQIAYATEKGAYLTQSLLAFARREVNVSQKSVDLNRVLLGMQDMLERLVGEDIQFTMRLHLAPLPIMGNQGQLVQVVMNLCVNARGAMPHGGRLTIMTTRSRDMAILSVDDNGTGIPAEIRDKIFEPFFTTNRSGKGNGLGLAITRDIVGRHNGTIRIESEVGIGTTFFITLPLTSEPIQDLHDTTNIESLRSTNGETILLAEDNPELLGAMKELLDRHGYRVIPVRSGAEAVEAFYAQVDAIDLLLFDVVMPHKNGPEAYSEIAAVRPKIPILFLSGYTANATLPQHLNASRHLISKPVDFAALLVQIKSLLQNGADTSAN